MRLFIVFLILSSAQLWASTSYECKTIDDNQPYAVEELRVKIISDEIVNITIPDLGVTEKYQVDPKYRPISPAMKNYARLNVADPDIDAYGEGPLTPFYIEKSLFTGGAMQLHEDKFGGLIKIAGIGFRWAKYLCLRN